MIIIVHHYRFILCNECAMPVQDASNRGNCEGTERGYGNCTFRLIFLFLKTALLCWLHTYTYNEIWLHTWDWLKHWQCQVLVWTWSKGNCHTLRVQVKLGASILENCLALSKRAKGKHSTQPPNLCWQKCTHKCTTARVWECVCRYPWKTQTVKAQMASALVIRAGFNLLMGKQWHVEVHSSLKVT